MTVATAGVMKFSQIDRIVDLQVGKSVTAVRRVDPDEELLQDHFPLFAVLPGVLMLEAIYQSCCWLTLATEDFRIGSLVLAEAKNVKFADFLAPGEVLTIHCELIKTEDDRWTFKCQGSKGDVTAVSARIVIAHRPQGLPGDPQELHEAFVASARRQQFQQFLTKQ